MKKICLVFLIVFFFLPESKSQVADWDSVASVGALKLKSIPKTENFPHGIPNWFWTPDDVSAMTYEAYGDVETFKTVMRKSHKVGKPRQGSSKTAYMFFLVTFTTGNAMLINVNPSGTYFFNHFSNQMFDFDISDKPEAKKLINSLYDFYHKVNADL